MNTYHSVFRKDLFAGQSVVVTWGGSGIGRRTAHELAPLGAHGVLLGPQAAQLKATVARNNELYRKGEDVDYGKEKHRLSAVDKAPFYGAKNTGWMLCTMDGIQINTNMNAIDTEGNPIPGLFVIGNDSGGYFANEYPNLATGMACGRTVTFGRIVGRMLAKA